MYSLWIDLKELWQLYFRCNLPRAAGALAFFFVLSCFPLLLCITALVGLAQGELPALLPALKDFLPREALALLADYAYYAAQTRSPAVLCAALPALLLSASAALRVLLDTMGELFCRPHSTGLRRITLSVLLALLFLAAAVLSAALILSAGWQLRGLLLFCLVAALALAVYWIGIPQASRYPRPVLMGALLCAGTLVGSSAVFSRLVELSTRHSLLYGSLASIMILLLWLYLCGSILLLGAAFLRIWTKKHPKP